MGSTMSLSTLAMMKKSGLGQGRFEMYQPWLRIRRNFSSPISKQVFCNLTLRKSNHHLLSGSEYKVGLLNAWLGPEELRECLPMWPEDHRHPQCGFEHPDEPKLAKTQGLLDIAREAGIDHGYFIGTKIPYVGTCDLIFCCPVDVPIQKRLVFISCKSRSEIEGSPRARERLELDRRYALKAGGKHILETGERLPPKLIDNLDWMLPLRSEVKALKQDTGHSDFCSQLMNMSSEMPLGEAIERSREKFRLSIRQGFQYFRVGVWLHRIDINLNKPVVMSKMMERDDGCTLRRWRSHYWPDQGSTK